MKVAGLERGLLPIGSWLTCMTELNASNPSIERCLPGIDLARFSLKAACLARIPLIRVLLPEPDLPQTTLINPIGNDTSMVFKLFSSAPIILKYSE